MSCPPIKPKAPLPRVTREGELVPEPVQQNIDSLDSRVRVLEARTGNPDCICAPTTGSDTSGLQAAIDALQDQLNAATAPTLNGAIAAGPYFPTDGLIPFQANVNVGGTVQVNLAMVVDIQAPGTDSLGSLTDLGLGGWTNTTNWTSPSLGRSQAVFSRTSHPVGASTLLFSGKVSSGVTGSYTFTLSVLSSTQVISGSINPATAIVIKP